jgi:molybdopterin synthase sulfur carrier subunit
VEEPAMIMRIFGTLRQLVGSKEVQVKAQPNATARTVLMDLAIEYPALQDRLFDDDGNLKGSIHLLVNGRNITFLDGLDSPIREGDQLALFPAVGGG